MPRGDGTGPAGQGPGTGRGLGRGQGKSFSGLGGAFPGRGPGGQCVCPACGAQVPHQPGTPCTSVSCPQCDTKMVRR